MSRFETFAGEDDLAFAPLINFATSFRFAGPVTLDPAAASADGANAATVTASALLTPVSFDAPAVLDLSALTEGQVVDLETGLQTRAARVLTIGDSITAGFFTESGYRLELWNGLVEESGLWIDFVGGQTDSPTGALRDPEHFGIGGYRIDDFAPFMGGIVSSYAPDVVLVMLGTNDVLVSGVDFGSGVLETDAAATVPSELLQLLRNTHAAQPGVHILLSTLPALNQADYLGYLPNFNPDGEIDVAAINAALPGIIAQAQLEGINVSLVDQSDFNALDLHPGDGIHPDAPGDAKLALNWQEALSTGGAFSDGTLYGSGTAITGFGDVIGTAFGDRIGGDVAANNINGGDGNDWLEGRGDIDTLTGGAGRDTFAILEVAHSGDIITDFVSGEDRIVLNARNFGGDLEVGQPVSLIVDGAPATTGSTFLYNSTTGELSFDVDGTGSVAAIVVAQLSGAPTLTAADIELTGRNYAPVLNLPIGDQNVDEASEFNFTLPAGTFEDFNGDAFTLTATLSNDDPLPAWLQFDSNSGTFLGTPPEGDVGTFTVKVTATDIYGATGEALFDLTVNDVPNATITARVDDQFWLYVNGTLVAAANSWTTIATVAINLAPGDVIAVRALDWGGPGGAFVDIDFLNDERFATSSAWKVSTTAPTGWEQQGFDDSAWLAATEYGDFDTSPWNYAPNGQVPSDSPGQWIWTSNATGDDSVYLRFTIPDFGVNTAPTLDNPISDQASNEEAAFSFIIPANTFSDVDGDTLVYSVTLANGDPLPAWLSFNPATLTLSGTPDDADVGAISVKVSVNDGRGGVVSDLFTLTVNPVNDAPVLANPIADQSTDENAPFSFTLPAGTFSDVDDATLSLSAELSGGGPLPAWLSFNPATGSFSGTPDDADIGTISIRVTATDATGATAQDTFDLTVNSDNDAPVLALPVADQAIDEEAVFSFTFPAGTFTDAEGDTLNWTVTLANGDPLPAWLSFDAETRTLSGTPDDAENGTISLKVSVDDGNGGTGEDVFDLTVNPVNDAPVATDDTAITEEDVAVIVDVLANDTDADGPALSVAAIAGTAVTAGDSVDVGDAMVMLNLDGTLTVTADADFNGEIAFSYTVTEGTDADDGDVSVTVSPVAAGADIGFSTGITVDAIERVSQTASGTQANGLSTHGVISSDNSVMAFRSVASNLVAGDTNGRWDIFLKDLDTGEVTRVSTSSTDGQANGNSYYPMFSADGTMLVFRSDASNLVAGDTNGKGDIFVKNLLTGEIERVSTGSGEEQADGDSDNAAFSADGEFVVFESNATNLARGDTNGATDLFLKNLATGVTTRVSLNSIGSQANGASHNASLSQDGVWMVFESDASNLVLGDTNGTTDIFLKNLWTGQVSRISVDALGEEANSASQKAVLSADGTKVAFQSAASDLVDDDGNGRVDVFVKDLITGEVTRISVDTQGGDANSNSYEVDFSADGSRLILRSYASDLVDGDANGKGDIFVADLVTGEITRVSAPQSGEANGNSFFASISDDGTLVTFRSEATNLVDADTNGQQDVFLAHLGQGFHGVQNGDAIALPIAVTPTEAGESVSQVVLSGLPAGSVLSAGISNVDGTEWTFDSAPPSDLRLTPPSTFSGSFDLTVTVTTTDGSDTEVTTDTQEVVVQPDGSAPPEMSAESGGGAVMMELVDLDAFDFSAMSGQGGAITGTEASVTDLFAHDGGVPGTTGLDVIDTSMLPDLGGLLVPSEHQPDWTDFLDAHWDGQMIA